MSAWEWVGRFVVGGLIFSIGGLAVWLFIQKIPWGTESPKKTDDQSLRLGLSNALGRIEELEKWKRDVELQLSRAKEQRPSVMASRGFTGWKRSVEETAKEAPIVRNSE